MDAHTIGRAGDGGGLRRERTLFAPNAPFSVWVKCSALPYLQRFDEAILLAEQLAGLLPGVLPPAALAVVLAQAGRRDRALALARDLESRRETEYVQPRWLADIYCSLGDADRTIAWLERAFEERNGLLPAVFQMPAYRWLHDDPRFIAVFRRMNFGDTYRRPS